MKIFFINFSDLVASAYLKVPRHFKQNLEILKTLETGKERTGPIRAKEIFTKISLIVLFFKFYQLGQRSLLSQFAQPAETFGSELCV